MIEYELIDVKVNNIMLKPERTPRYILLHSPILISEVLKMLANPSTEIANEAWSFVVDLPGDETIAKKMETIEFTEDNYMTSWPNVLQINDLSNICYLTYSLHNLLKLLRIENKIHKERGCHKFVYKIFKANIKANFDPITVRCLYYCLKILNLLWDSIFVEELSINYKKVWDHTCKIIDWVLSKKGEQMNSDDITETLNACKEFHIKLCKNPSDIISEVYLNLYKNGINLLMNRTVQFK